MDSPRPQRNPWPITITAWFALFFLGLVAFIVFASRRPEDLVRPDYYEAEIRYQQQLDRVSRTQQVRPLVSVSYDPALRSIVVRLPAAHAQTSSGRVEFYRPSDARLDLQRPLTPDSNGVQTLDVSQLRAGLWKIKVHWTLAGEEYFFDQPVILPATG